MDLGTSSKGPVMRNEKENEKAPAMKGTLLLLIFSIGLTCSLANSLQLIPSASPSPTHFVRVGDEYVPKETQVNCTHARLLYVDDD